MGSPAGKPDARRRPCVCNPPRYSLFMRGSAQRGRDVTAGDQPTKPRPLRAVPDGGLNDDFKKGDDFQKGYADWEAVYQDNATWVYRTLFARVGNRADAEDLTTEVFLAALRPLRLTASVAEVRAYLRATARTVLAAHWRQTLGCEVTYIEDIEEPPESEDAISTAPGRVAQVLDKLPDNYRRILELRFLQGRSIKESAAELGVSVANAKVLQHRALRLAAQVNEGGES